VEVEHTSLSPSQSTPTPRCSRKKHGKESFFPALSPPLPSEKAAQKNSLYLSFQTAQ
jgi:hypothetical protein